jgi:hypothetical protein
MAIIFNIDVMLAKSNQENDQGQACDFAILKTRSCELKQELVTRIAKSQA